MRTTRDGVGSRFAPGLVLAFLLPSLAFAQPSPSVVSVGFTVSDLDREVALFTQVLGFERVSEVELWGDEYEHLTGVFGARTRVARLRLGSETVELTEFLTPQGRPIPLDSKSYDHWFQHVAIVVSDMDAAYARLREHKVRHVSSGPQTLPAWNPNAGGIRAFYFQDPDGHNLEVIWYPTGKGDPRWQAKDRLFLGIDHTAIVVGDTEASLRFYRDAVGLKVAGTSENYGTEQEHLNLVFGARLRITGLRGDGGPGIEFLEYLTPGGGRAVPPDAAANDLTHWHVTLSGSKLAPANRTLRMLDPDGHVVEISQP
jgi:catechol 2,3-dioxygenase-like lactoylglutathione lyase family enzyme